MQFVVCLQFGKLHLQRAIQIIMHCLMQQLIQICELCSGEWVQASGLGCVGCEGYHTEMMSTARPAGMCHKPCQANESKIFSHCRILSVKSVYSYLVSLNCVDWLITYLTLYSYLTLVYTCHFTRSEYTSCQLRILMYPNIFKCILFNTLKFPLVW